jgi:hypothetical protein
MRDIKDIVTPAGHTLSVYTYVTGKEARALRAPYLKQADEYPREMIDEKGLRASVLETVENLTLKTLIVSFDGKTDGQDGFDLLDTLLSLPSTELKAITTALNSVIAEAESEEKKTN